MVSLSRVQKYDELVKKEVSNDTNTYQIVHCTEKFGAKFS